MTGHGPDDAERRPDQAGGQDEVADAPRVRVPDAVREATRRAFDTRALDADVADLIYDSLVDADPAVASPGDVRRLTFAVGEARVHLEVTGVTGEVGVSLVLQPPRRARVEVRADDTALTVQADDDGRGEFRLLSGTLTSLIVPSSSDGRGLQTAWVRL